MGSTGNKEFKDELNTTNLLIIFIFLKCLTDQKVQKI
jgi:hypothetical protein